MAKSEPTLIPEWLKNAGNSNGRGSLSHSDNRSNSGLVRNKSSVNNNVRDSGRYSSSSERTTSSYFRRSSSSNGSGGVRSHGSFGRNHRQRERDKDNSADKDNLVLREPRLWDFPETDTLVDPISSKFENGGLRRSQSMISGKHGETWPRKAVNDSKNENGNNNNISDNDVLYKAGSIGGASKQNFERDFPSLGADGKTIASDIDRVSSPGFGSALQSLPIGTSAMLGGEKWKSALAEVPVLAESSGTVQQNTTSGPKSMATGLNMAEAVVLGPIRAQTPPQSSIETQRLEELVIKQTRQLIPVTPSLPKTLVSISSEKQKNKASQHQFPASSSLSLNQSPRGVSVVGNVSKASDAGKLHVLKPGREINCVSPILKDKSSSKNVDKAINTTVSSSASVSVTAATRVPPVNSVPDRGKLPLAILEKKPTYQARSRNDFFNSVRKQSKGNPSSSSYSYSTMPNSSSDRDTGDATSSSLSDNLSEIEVAPICDSPQMVVNTTADLNILEDHSSDDGAELTSDNGDGCDVERHFSGKKNRGSDPIISEEEEAAFLRSLGWEENDDEGGLTEEEINAFYRDLSKYINSDASLRILQLQGIQDKLLLPQMSGVGDGVLSSSDAKMES